MNIQDFFNALPEAAVSPPAFVAYIFVAVLSFMTGRRTLEVKGAYAAIKDLPEEARSAVVSQVLGEPVPPNLTAEQWLRYKRLKLLSMAGLLLVGLIAVLAAMSYFRAKEKLEIDKVDVRTENAAARSIRVAFPEISNWLLIANPTSDASTATPAIVREVAFTEAPKPVKAERFTYVFDVTLRNSGSHDATVTEARITFDRGKGGILASVQEVSGTYVVILDSKGSTVDTPLGRYDAYAWYPSGYGRLIVKTPLSQTVPAGKVDRIRIMVKLGDRFELRGPMEDAEIELTWNGKNRIVSADFKLPPRPKAEKDTTKSIIRTEP